jgi:hypothetical protein
MSSSSTSNAAPDKEAFQIYLESTGLLDTLTQSECTRHAWGLSLTFCSTVLADLYDNPNRPPDAIAAFAGHLGAVVGMPSCEIFVDNAEFFFFFFFFSTDKSEDVSLLRGEIEALKAEKQQANKKIEELERTVAELRKQLPAAKSD